MNPLPRVQIIGSILLAGALLLAGCGSEGEKTDPKALEAAFKETPPEAAPAAAEESTTDNSVPVAARGAVAVKEIAGRAAAAMRKDDMAEAMVLLQTLRRAKGLGPDQLTAVQDQMAALQGELAGRAAGGDAKAKAALELIQNSRRW